ncbi:MAG: B12-binding domain-containing radical SAM protein [Candidatus Eremiobacteraeota bacterium]|nr:B12-binding domain-containing radical SAM protein [Candidatus Eremiobacteraeota bacterium]
MKISLVSPRGAERNQQNDIIFDIYEEMEGHLALMMDDIEFIPNLALLTLASYLDPSWDLQFIEEDYVPEERVEEMLFQQDFDLALISIVNYTAPRGYEIADRYREMGVYVVIGGLHASALPEEALLHADTVVVGEGEEILPIFMDDFLNGNPKEIYRSVTPADLTKIPPARYDLIKNPGRYNKMPVFATRGCPRNCDFCCFPNLYGRKYRHKTVQQVLTDIGKIIEIHREPYIHFCDENLFCDREFSKELVRAIKPLNVPWECFCDIGIAEDDELLSLLENSGCRDLLIGLETVNPEIMEKIDPWKYRKLKKYKEDIRKIQSYKLPVTGLFILGFDGDDTSVFRNICDFISDVGLYDMDFAILTPIPGSELYTRLKSEGRIISENWSHYTWTHVNFQPMHMTPEKLQEGLLWIFREFASSSMLQKRERAGVRGRQGI